MPGRLDDLDAIDDFQKEIEEKEEDAINKLVASRGAPSLQEKTSQYQQVTIKEKERQLNMGTLPTSIYTMLADTAEQSGYGRSLRRLFLNLAAKDGLPIPEYLLKDRRFK